MSSVGSYSTRPLIGTQFTLIVVLFVSCKTTELLSLHAGVSGAPSKAVAIEMVLFNCLNFLSCTIILEVALALS